MTEQSHGCEQDLVMPSETFFNLPSDKRALIIDAAIDEFAAHPYHSASLSHLVTRCGIAKGSLYQYFDHKFDLYRWLVTDYLAQRKLEFLHDRLSDLEADDDFFRVVTHLCEASIDFTAADPRLTRLTMRMMQSRDDPELADLHRDLQDMSVTFFHDLIGRWQTRGAIRRDLPADLLARLTDGVFHAIHQQVLDLISDDDNQHPVIDRHGHNQLAGQVVAFLRDGLTGPLGS